jgi:signal transduction histidine kinase
MPSVGTLSDGVIVATASAVLLEGAAAALFLGAVGRRHLTMPDSVRSSVRPALLGASLLALSELWILACDVALGPLWQQRAERQPFGTARDIVALGRFGVVALLLLVAQARRRRAARASLHERRYELGPLERTIEPGPEIARLLRDPSARLLVRGVDDVDAVVDGRGRIELVDHNRVLVAVVDHAAGIPTDVTTRDALLVAIELAVLRIARAADARARTGELRVVQRAVLDAHDRARRRLERDLHDGVQQRLVALTLEASLAARREHVVGPTEDVRNALAADIASSIEQARSLMRAGVPAVLDRGLAAGLAALAATIPMSSALDVEGDLDSDHPATAVLWFVASEAIGNALKHANATRIDLHLKVDEAAAELIVRDDGIGGTSGLPRSIAERLVTMPSTCRIISPTGHGTAVHVRVDLVRESVLV